MNEYFVSAHGGRNAGTVEGTLVVPEGLELYFYSMDGAALSNALAKPLFNDLSRSVGAGRIYQTFVKRIVKQYQTVPNYRAFGAKDKGADADIAFKGYPTGIYKIGKHAPSVPITFGMNVSLEQIIYCVKPHLRGRLHWLCCTSNLDPNIVGETAFLHTYIRTELPGYGICFLPSYIPEFLHF